MTAALVGLICVAASAVILVALHFVPTGLDPIRYAVSDYGWTSYQLGYRMMVVLQGVGADGDRQSGWAKRPTCSPLAGSTSTASPDSSSSSHHRSRTARSPLALAYRSHPHASRRDGLCLDRRRSVALELDGQARRSRPDSDGSSRQRRSRPYRACRRTDSTCRARSDRADPLRRCHHLADRRVGLDHLGRHDSESMGPRRPCPDRDEHRAAERTADGPPDRNRLFEARSDAQHPAQVIMLVTDEHAPRQTYHRGATAIDTGTVQVPMEGAAWCARVPECPSTEEARREKRFEERGPLRPRPSIPRLLPPCAPQRPPRLHPSHEQGPRSDRACVPAPLRPHRTPRGRCGGRDGLLPARGGLPRFVALNVTVRRRCRTPTTCA